MAVENPDNLRFDLDLDEPPTVDDVLNYTRPTPGVLQLMSSRPEVQLCLASLSRTLTLTCGWATGGSRVRAEHAMALMAELAKPDVNRMKIAHEGLLGPIMQSITVPNQGLQLHALAALGRLCEKPQIAVLMTQRGVPGCFSG